jgi:amino acid permease
MTDINKYAHGDVSSEEKGYQYDPAIAGGRDIEPDIHHHLHRGLKSRQVAMIAIGGAIGMSALSDLRKATC